MIPASIVNNTIMRHIDIPICNHHLLRKLVCKMTALLLTSIIFGANAAEVNSDWRIKENHNNFDNSLVSLIAVRSAENSSGGWFSVSCDIKSKKFLINIVSRELGFRQSENFSNTKNFRYKIDELEPKVVTMLQVVDGAASSSKPELEMLKDIIKGGEFLTTQPILTGAENSFIEKFDLNGASETIEKIIESCR